MKKIVIVEDDESFAKLLSKILGEEFELSIVSTAEEAISLDYFDVDAAIVDMALPDYTGFYLCTEFRKIKESLPIAILTNYNGDITKMNAENVGAEYWYKPKTIGSKDLLLDLVRKLVHG